MMDEDKFYEVFSGINIDENIMYEIYINFSTHNFDELKFVYDKTIEYHQTIPSIKECVKKSINDIVLRHKEIN